MAQGPQIKSTMKTIALLKQVKPDSLWGIAIHKVLKDPEPGKVNELVIQLKDQAKDCPDTMRAILGSVYDEIISD